MATTNLVLALAGLLPVYFLTKYYFGMTTSTGFVLGPPTVLFLGNLHQIPLIKPYIQFAEWSRQYGVHGLLGLQIGPWGKTVVLNNWRSVRDLLDQRGSIYSSRPHVTILDYVLPPPGNLHLGLMPYGPKWRDYRKSLTNFLSNEGTDRLIPIQDAESSQMIFELLEDPERHERHVRRFFGAVIMDSVYGTREKLFSDDAKIKRFFDMQVEWGELLDQGTVPPLDLFPALKYIPDFISPWRGWRQRAESLKATQSALYREFFRDAKQRIESGKGQGSFLARVLKNKDMQAYGQVELEYFMGFMIEAGADTTAGAYDTFVLAMAANPRIQRKAQAEVEKVFGRDGIKAEKIPTAELPFLRACFQETLRWRPGLPTAIPHAIKQNDSYQGFTIPADTTVIMNTWAIHNDPDEFEEPEIFDPERYMSNALGIKATGSSLQEALADPSRRSNYWFGAGRRVCAGQRMAENSLMMLMAKTLWSFDIVAKRPLDTSLSAFRDAILTGPKELAVEYKLRSEDRRLVITRDWERADDYLKRFE